MTFVLDASVTLPWFLPDEDSPMARAVLQRLSTDDAIVPQGWLAEVANGLLMGERRRRSTEAGTAISLARLATAPIRVASPIPDPTAHWVRLLGLARQHNLTAYDAAYLDLAIQERVPLATLDDDLRNAARQAHVPLVGAT